MKNLMITFLFSAFIFNVKAQVWVDSGAVWHYDFGGFSPSMGFLKYVYTSDTLILGRLCQKIEVERYSFLYYGNDTLLYKGTTLGETNYTSVSGDTVLYYRNNQFYPLLNFGASVGDSWVVSVDAPMNANDSDSSEVIVTGVDSVLINSQYYRSIEIEMNTCSKYHYEGTFVERFGFVSISNSGLFPVLKEYSCPLDTLVQYHPTIYTFKCFEDENFNLYNPTGQDCEFLLSILGDEEFYKEKWQVYPNPATSLVQINGENLTSKELTVFDIMGQLVTKITINSDNYILSVQDFKPGIYFLMIEGSTEVRKLMVE